MNKIFKVIWSKIYHRYIVVSEYGRSVHKKSLTAIKLTTIGLMASTLLVGNTMADNGSRSGDVYGGNNNSSSGFYSVASGGRDNNVSSHWSSIFGGQGNSIAIYPMDATILGGTSNTIGNYSGGDNGKYGAVITGGYKNSNSGSYSLIAGGESNVITPTSSSSVVVGGSKNTAAGESTNGVFGLKSISAVVVGGTENTAAGKNSAILGGYQNRATNYGSVVIGGIHNIAIQNLSTENYAVALGGQNSVVQGGESVGIGGGSTSYDATNAVAVGYGSVAEVKNALALGYQATTSEGGTIAFGHDAGDISGYTLKWQLRKDNKTNADGTTIDYNQNPIATRQTYTSAYYNRLVKIADGQAAHDAATLGQTLELVAGDNVTVADDSTATNSIGQKRKKLSVVGTGTASAGSTGLITGDTLYNAVKDSVNKTYVDTAVAKKADADTVYAKSETYSQSDIDSKVTSLTDSINQKADTGLSNITDAGKSVITDLAKDSMKVIAGTNTTVTEGTDGSVKTYAVNVDDQAIIKSVQPKLDEKADASLGNLTDAGKAVIKDTMKSDMVQKANIDASNIDTSSYTQKLGTGTNEQGSTGLVTGDTLYSAVKDKADTSYVDAGLSKKADADTIYTKDETYSRSEVDDKASSLTQSIDKKADLDLGNISDAGKTVIKDTMKNDIALKANTDASNIDTASYAQKLGTGTNEQGSSGLVTGDTLHNAVKDKADTSYVDAGLSKKADAASVYTKSETYDRAEIDSKITNLTENASGKADTSLANITDAGKSVITDLAKSSMKVIAGTNTTVTEDTDGSTKTYAVNVDDQAIIKAVQPKLDEKADASLGNITDAGKAVIKDTMKDDMAAKANTDASNIDAASYAKKLGTGTNEQGSTGLVTGDTLYNAVKDKADTSYVDEGLDKKADKDSVYTKDETYSRSEVDGKVTGLTQDMGRKADTDLSNITDSGKSVITDLAKNSMKVIAGTNTTVTEGTDGSVKTYAVNVDDQAIIKAVQPKLDEKADTGLSNLSDAGKAVIRDTMKDGMAKKANIDASNIDAASYAQKLGTGRANEGSTGLVTGDTLYGAVRDKADMSYVDEGLHKKADKASVYTKGETYSRHEVDAKDTALTQAMDKKADSSLGNLSEAGKAIIKDTMKDDLAKKANADASNITGDAVTNWQKALGTGSIRADDGGLVTGSTVYSAIKALPENLVTYDSATKTIAVAPEKEAAVVDFSGKDDSGQAVARTLTGVATDVHDVTSAANVGYVQNIAGELVNGVQHVASELSHDINKVGAGAAALAGLHPGDFDPDNKLDFAAGYGHYKDANAGALGVFYHPNEDTIINFSGTMGNGDPMLSAGVTFKLGPSGPNTLSRTALTRKIDALQQQNNRLTVQNQTMADKLAAVDARNAQLEKDVETLKAQVEALLAAKK